MKTSNNAVFKSQKVEWHTDSKLFEDLNKEFIFKLDAFATKENSKCEKFFTISQNALWHKWEGPVFMNPPYGPLLGQCVRKAWEECKRGGQIIVGLLPARTDTKWFHAYCLEAAEIRFIKGRLKFEGAKHNAPFPSMVVIWKP